ncbi:hypothetical protein H5410_034853 [Solanum commersonii]|uniref:DUF4283 domain-containing protein n=1 Tax=Solanum commersonii TaxID=4109 RepID=A0A9J5Y0A5_SOLCO|nr:hypothetical protein H5410_034853 [Solanum commersonii]
MKDQMAEYFSTRKFNAHGRFMSLLSLKGADRAVVILPEASNAGWKDIALINYSPPRTLKAPHRMVDINHSDAKVVEDSKWQSYTTEVPESKRQEVSTAATIFLEDVSQETSAILALRCLPSPRVQLEWWNPIAGCTPAAQKSKTTWIRAIGLPLHLWSHKIFRQIGDFCGGWKSTEKETGLKNHLKSARIEVKGDGQNIPREVTITKEGLNFFIPIRLERKPSFRRAPVVFPALGDEKINGTNKNFVQRSLEPYEPNLLTMPRRVTEALYSWEEAGALAKDRTRWRIIPASIWWAIWKERNSRCFEGIENSVQDVKLNCILLLCFWCNQLYSNDTASIVDVLDSI